MAAVANECTRQHVPDYIDLPDHICIDGTLQGVRALRHPLFLVLLVHLHLELLVVFVSKGVVLRLPETMLAGAGG